MTKFLYAGHNNLINDRQDKKRKNLLHLAGIKLKNSFIFVIWYQLFRGDY